MFRDEELFLHYGYDPLCCPPWYKEAVDEYLLANPHLELWQIADPEQQVTFFDEPVTL